MIRYLWNVTKRKVVDDDPPSDAAGVHPDKFIVRHLDEAL